MWLVLKTDARRPRRAAARRGYQEISTPILVHKKLWQQSGHWDLYREHLFLIGLGRLPVSAIDVVTLKFLLTFQRKPIIFFGGLAVFRFSEPRFADTI